MADVKADGFAHFDLGAMSKADGYKLLASVILPRPIAWVVTRDAEGLLNAAPFSFFNILSADPPLVAIGFSGASDRDGKDTLANIRAQGEFVVNLVPEELAQAMNITATNAPRGVDETRLAGLELTKCEVVKVPRIVGSPVGAGVQIISGDSDGRDRDDCAGTDCVCACARVGICEPGEAVCGSSAAAADWENAWVGGILHDAGYVHD